MKNNICMVIAQQGKRQVDVACMVGVKREYLNRIANGHITPTISLAIRIARALDTTAEKLWGEYVE
jgi:DNA-binding XRE family transcriptional regulator